MGGLALAVAAKMAHDMLTRLISLKRPGVRIFDADRQRLKLSNLAKQEGARQALRRLIGHPNGTEEISMRLDGVAPDDRLFADFLVCCSK
jgi:hypothetical protein